jgi:hypothetical protein
MITQAQLNDCKRRALGYLPAEPVNAMAEFVSALQDYDLAFDPQLVLEGLRLAERFDPELVRKYIKEFRL